MLTTWVLADDSFSFRNDLWYQVEFGIQTNRITEFGIIERESAQIGHMTLRWTDDIIWRSHDIIEVRFYILT